MASNVVTTTDQYRQSYQYSASVDGLLKNVYIPALNNTTFHATPLMEMFGDFGGVIDFAGAKIIKAFKHQGAGGFGAISEGGDFVKGRNQKGFQGAERVKYLNAYFSLTGPASKTVRTGVGSYVDAISDAMDDTLKLARMQMERILGGAGNGELCQFTIPIAVSETALATNEEIPLTGTAVADTHYAQTATAGGAYTYVQWLQPGQRVNLIEDEHWASTIATSDMVLDSGAAAAVFEVTSVDYTNNQFGLKNVSASSATVNCETYDDILLHVVLEGAYGEIEAAGGVTSDSCLEPNGLYNLVSDGATSGETDYTSIWGLTRSTYPDPLKSTVVAAASAELDEELLIGYLLDLVNIKQSIPNVLVTDPKARLKYFSNRKEDRRFDMTVMDSMFGFRSIGVVIDNYSLVLQSLSSLTPGTLFLLNTNDFKFAKATNGFEWTEGDGGRVLRNKEGSDNMFGSALNYMNFVCENPKGQFKATGLAT